MAIRIRKINNEIVALCAAKSKSKNGDTYLDDAIHHALTIKFEKDFRSMGFLKNENKKDNICHHANLEFTNYDKCLDCGQFQELNEEDKTMEIGTEYIHPLKSPLNHPLDVNLKELKWGRPINEQEFLDECIDSYKKLY